MNPETYSSKNLFQGLNEAHHRYLEAIYHLWNESLIEERRALLDEAGTTFQPPFLEATPKYPPGPSYQTLDLPREVQELLIQCAELGEVGVFRQPYQHQGKAMEAFITHCKSLIVASGTGSGKTECFLFPLLGTLAMEGIHRPTTASQPGFRALVLYPMNALVNDQLGRLRKLFGNPKVAEWLTRGRNRRVRFGVYTSRTPYPGHRNREKDKNRLEPWSKLDASVRALLQKENKWPAKNLEYFKDHDYTTGLEDRELLTRHEMHATCPDILVTNYSMLEYMLIRPIEREIFHQTKTWLHSHQDNFLTVVLDEAHMYRGAAGAEVALLLRRLLARLEAGPGQVRFILTSASLGKGENDQQQIVQFARQLTGVESWKGTFELITGQPEILDSGVCANHFQGTTLADCDFSFLHRTQENQEKTIDALNRLARALGWPKPLPANASDKEIRHVLFENLHGFPPARLLAEKTSSDPIQRERLVMELFPGQPRGAEALETLIALCCHARRKQDNQVFLPLRMHLFFRGLSGIFTCINPQCSHRRVGNNPGPPLLGRFYSEPRLRCKCGGRVYELLSHRECGAAFLRGFQQGEDGDFMWHEPGISNQGGAALLETHFLFETERIHPKAKSGVHIWLHIPTGRIFRSRPSVADVLPLFSPDLKVRVEGREMLTFDQECPVCLCGWRNGDTRILSLATGGDAPFAHLIEYQFRMQPPTQNATAGSPNAGRKSLIFSDGRQRAARLARDIPRTMEREVFRKVMLSGVQELQRINEEARLDDGTLYAAFLNQLERHRLRLFDGRDEEVLRRHVKEIGNYHNLEEVLDERIMLPPPSRYKVQLLIQLCHPYHSVAALTLGMVLPSQRVMKKLSTNLNFLSPGELEAVAANWILGLLEEMAFDPDLFNTLRIKARGFDRRVWGVVPGTPKKRLERIEAVFGQAERIDAVCLENLTQIKDGSHFLLPRNTILRPAFRETWYQCPRCTHLTLYPFRSQCPSCGREGMTVLHPDTSTYLRARKGFWRKPVEDVLEKQVPILNIDVREHTAQLSHLDVEEMRNTAEEHELRFKDILLEPSEKAVDILSSTTTMEVGIDIGSLVAVGMGNVPPMRQNYQQRAGRAGRRGASLSSILTYARATPHDHDLFLTPERIIAGPPPRPFVDVSNPNLIRRHLHAALIQAFFHARVQRMKRDSDLFTTLGTTRSFFTPDGDFSLEAFSQWLQAPEGKSALKQCQDWIPPGCDLSPLEVATELVRKLQDIQPKDFDRLGERKELLEFLFGNGLLPSYAFPRDLCALQIEATWKEKGRERLKILERPQQSMAIALSEYSPGRIVVVNNQSYRVGTVAADLPSKERDRGAPLFDSARHFIHCNNCDYIQVLPENPQAPLPCPLCGHNDLRPVRVLQPEVVFPEGGQALDELDDDPIFTETTRAQLPTPEGDWMQSGEPFGQQGHLVTGRNRTLIQANKGRETSRGHSGFRVCTRCGKAGLPDQISEAPHERDYRIEPLKSEQRCMGPFQGVYLGYTFRTDILLLRFPLAAPLRTELHDAYLRLPLEHALLSLAEALSLAACLDSQLDPRELSCGQRLLMTAGGPMADLFLYDTASGGAGYAHEAGQHLKDSIANRMVTLLERCDCHTSCHKCLRHFGNRFDHPNLHRHLALELWHFLVEGQAPPIPSKEEQYQWLDPLIAILKLAGWSEVTSAQFPRVVQKGNQRVPLGVYSYLGSASGHPLEKQAMLCGRYELERNLPGVFTRVIEARNNL